jgi:hypothetical protein
MKNNGLPGFNFRPFVGEDLVQSLLELKKSVE